MALTERNRNALYQGLIRIIDDQEAVDAMLSHFPARDDDEPATHDHLRAETAALDQRITLGLAETNQRMTEGFAAIDQRFAAVDQRITEGLGAIDQRMTGGFAAVDVRFATLEKTMAGGFANVAKEVHHEMRQWFLWSYGAMFVLLVAVVTAAKFLE